MKHTLLITALFSSLFASAQLTQSNEPLAGETQSLFLCDSFVTNYAGTIGSGVTWDYSDLLGYQGEVRTVEVVDASSTPDAAVFPGATKAYKVGPNIMTYFDSDVNSRWSQGFKFTEATIGDVFVTFENDNLDLVQYPFGYGDSFEDAFSGTMDFVFNSIPINEAVTGNAYTGVDGTGTLMFPDGTNVSNVIRYKSIDTSETIIPIIGAVEIIREQYEYYDHATQNLPIFLHVTVTMQQPAAAPLAVVPMVLSKYAPQDYVGIKQKTLTSEIYPNPATTYVTITSEGTTDAQVAMMDQFGRVVYANEFNGSLKINLDGYESGVYFVTIDKDDVKSTQKLVVR